MAYIGTTPIDVRSFGTVKFEFTATSGQTAFTGTDDNNKVLSFVDDQLEVYVNGVLMDNDDFSTSGNNTVTLASAAAANDIITVNTLKSNAPITDYVQTSGGTFTGGINVSSGNVGIGTESPARKLTVTGSNNTTNFEVTDGSGGSTFNVYNNTTSNAVALGTSSDLMSIGFNGLDKVFFKSDGNVGIGTSNPSQRLHIYGATPQILIETSDSRGETWSIRSTNGAPSNTGTLSFRDEAGNNWFDLAQNAGAPITRFYSGASSERMVIKNDGKVGIGISNPAASWADGIGVQFNPVGEVIVNKSNNISVYANRENSSGSARHVIGIYEGMSPMGYLGMGSGSEFALVTPSSYISQKINNDTDGIQYSNVGTYHFGPWLSKNTAVDLGRDNGRWRDAYLGGNVYIGGAGTDSDHKLQIGEYNTNSASQSDGETKLIHVDDSYVMRVARESGSGDIASTGWYNVAKIPPFGSHGRVTVSLGGDFTADVVVIEWISSHNTALNNSTAAPQVTAKATFAHTSSARITNTRVARDSTTGTYYVQVYVSTGVNNNTNGKSVLEVHLGEYVETNNSNIQAMFSLYTGSVSHYFEAPIVTNGSSRTGRHTTPEQPYFLATLGASSFISNRQNGLYKLPFNQTKYNTGGHFNTSTNTFTAPVSGFYEFGVNIETNSNSVWDTSTWIYGGIFYLNGSTYMSGNDIYGISGKHQSWYYSMIYYLNANDYVDCRYYNTGNYIQFSTDNGGPSSTNNCRFHGRLLT